ncbi:hypothetical protein [Dongia deserti]|uniref:hypothetical protein n=1 Tax=Dongia deserti TaxID=2268030 RepID=UPI000E64FF6E|nr:hypothetical protein [Dongia deserti]
MSALASHIAIVTTLFPGQEAAVKALVIRSERFRSLCEDYMLAAETLTIMEKRNLPQDGEKMLEYRSLVTELAGELSEAFAESSE